MADPSGLHDSMAPVPCRAVCPCVSGAQQQHLGMSENVVYPIVPNGFADHYPYEKWLFHWEYTQHFQTNPLGTLLGGLQGLHWQRFAPPGVTMRSSEICTREAPRGEVFPESTPSSDINLNFFSWSKESKPPISISCWCLARNGFNGRQWGLLG